VDAQVKKSRRRVSSPVEDSMKLQAWGIEIGGRC
jgi:hypothetical protein